MTDSHGEDQERDETDVLKILPYGECDEDTNATMKEDPSFEQADKEMDVIVLQKILQSVNYSYKSGGDPTKTIFQTKLDLLLYRQGRTRLWWIISRNTRAAWMFVTPWGWTSMMIMVSLRSLPRRNVNDSNTEERTRVMTKGRERKIGMYFIMGTFCERRGAKIEHLEEAYLMVKHHNNNPNPPTLHYSYTPLKGWAAKKGKTHNSNQMGMSFIRNKEKGTTLTTGG